MRRTRTMQIVALMTVALLAGAPAHAADEALAVADGFVCVYHGGSCIPERVFAVSAVDASTDAGVATIAPTAGSGTKITLDCVEVSDGEASDTLAVSGVDDLGSRWYLHIAQSAVIEASITSYPTEGAPCGAAPDHIDTRGSLTIVGAPA